MTTTCKLCGGRSHFTHENLVLGRYTAEYFRCEECDFWFILDPFWLIEAYEKSISILDTGLVERNLRLSKSLRIFITSIFSGDFIGIDWSGGTGLLTRLMRDNGIPYLSTDVHTENIHAKGFDRKQGDQANLVSLIEVLEHIEYPLAFLSEILSECRPSTIVFTQHLHKGDNLPDWWYFMCDSGQHISFYSVKTLGYLEKSLGMKIGKYVDFYFITSLDFQNNPRYLVGYFRAKLESLISRFNRRKSLTWQDHEFLRKP